jgi:C4-dicarboxylate-specific signal transduction histidine kinase
MTPNHIRTAWSFPDHRLPPKNAVAGECWLKQNNDPANECKTQLSHTELPDLRLVLVDGIESSPSSKRVLDDVLPFEENARSWSIVVTCMAIAAVAAWQLARFANRWRFSKERAAAVDLMEQLTRERTAEKMARERAEKQAQTAQEKKSEALRTLDQALDQTHHQVAQARREAAASEASKMAELSAANAATVAATKAARSQAIDSCLCVVCLEEEKSILLQPCGHYCLCSQCSVSQKWLTCPVCRAVVTGKQRVFA